MLWLKALHIVFVVTWFAGLFYLPRLLVYHAEATEPVLRGLDATLRERVLVSSFEHPAVRLLKERLPWLRIAALYGGREWRWQGMLGPALDMGAEAIHPGLRLVTPELIQRAHAAGLRVNVWTANLYPTIRRLIHLGVDGIFSDYPERVVIVRARLAARRRGASPSGA
jgi:glycerophosphoryl diester phosphodiesterase